MECSGLLRQVEWVVWVPMGVLLDVSIVAYAAPGDALRCIHPHLFVVEQVVFQPYCSDLTQQPGRRKRGRPRQAWASELYKHAQRVCHGTDWNVCNLGTFPAEAWKAAVRKYTV